MKITPSWVASFETNIQTLIQDAWTRMAGHLIWSNYMEVRQSGTLRELYFWLIETAQIYDENLGGNKRFDDIAAIYREITNSASGSGLKLTKYEIEDNVMHSDSAKGIPAMQYASNWAKQIGGAGAYWPQQKLFELIAAGETDVSYDGVAFFNASHPINPYNTGSGVYANILTGGTSTYASGVMTGVVYPGACPIDSSVTLDVAATNLSKAVSYIKSLRQPNGKPRNLRPTRLLHAPILEKRTNEILTTAYFGGVGAGPTENVLSRWKLQPEEASELNGTDFYLGCEMLPGESGPFVFQNRDPYIMSSYVPATTLELQHKKEFEWDFDGRNAAAYGHPYLFFKVKAA
jgi:phage major head subunit gpT-like protein